MSSWICNTCDSHFEGGLFNTRNCPRCHSGFKDFLKIVWFFIKLAAVIVPVLFLLKIFKNDLFGNIAQTAENVLDLSAAAYYHPAIYFNNIIFVKNGAYYTIRNPKTLRSRISHSTANTSTAGLKEGQAILLRGVVPRGAVTWLAVEFYYNGERQRFYLAADQEWDTDFSMMDSSAVLNQAKIKFRDAVLSGMPYREVSGKDNIAKFSETHPEYFRLDIENTSFLKPLLSLFSAQYEVAYFVKKENRAKVEELRKKILDRTVIEKELLKMN